MTKRNILRTLGFTVILWGVGVYSVNNRGYASCTSQSGFSGLMNKVLFAPTADCALKKNSTQCQNNGATCTYKVPASTTTLAGKCATQADNTCACVQK